MAGADEARELAEQVLERLLSGWQAEKSSSFEAARHADDADAYAEHVLARAESVGPLMAACEDVADAVGTVDEDEALPAVRGAADQWQHAADALDARDRQAVALRAVAHRLHHLLDVEGLDPEYVTDLVSIAAAQWQLLQFAIERSHLRSDAGRDRWWTKNGEQVQATAEIWAYLRADVVARGGDVWHDFEAGTPDAT